MLNLTQATVSYRLKILEQGMGLTSSEISTKSNAALRWNRFIPKGRVFCDILWKLLVSCDMFRVFVRSFFCCAVIVVGFDWC